MRDLHQIKYEILNAGSTDVIGEWTIEELCLFHSTGRFSRVWLMWETVKRFCLLADQAHASEREKLHRAIKQLDRKEPVSEDELEYLFEISDLNTQTEHSSNILLKAVIVHLLASFVEFALKEVVNFLYPDNPVPQGKECRFQDHVVKPLRGKGFLLSEPDEYKDNVEKYRDSVRNAFAHGEWAQLAIAIESVSLDKAFLGTAQLIASVWFGLEEQGFDLDTPTIVPIRLPGEKMDDSA
jgi:hypothetical protein